MRKYQKMGCVRYAANDAKAAELERMGYEAVSATVNSESGSKRKSGKKGKAEPKAKEIEKPDKSEPDSVTDPEAPAKNPAPGGDDDGSDPTDNK